jgi:hypothetical protein
MVAHCAVTQSTISRLTTAGFSTWKKWLQRDFVVGVGIESRVSARRLGADGWKNENAT